VGAYRTNGVTAPRVDPNLFLILDFPKTTADFTPGSNEAGFWDKYFIEDPDAWRRASWARTAGDWRVWQALRHFGRANVLFCDGHVESLPPRWDTEVERAQGFYLYYSSPLWAFQGR
jgi:prepilin-type processing-associated H-X9-DG protein